MIGIQIKNALGQYVCHLPQTENHIVKRFHVLARYKFSNGKFHDLDTATGNNFYQFDYKEKKDAIVPVKNTQNDADLSHCHYGFYNLSIRDNGITEFHIQIRDPDNNDRLIFPIDKRDINSAYPDWYTAYSFFVPHDKIKLKVEWTADNIERNFQHVRLDDFLPDFDIKLLNEENEVRMQKYTCG